MRKPFKDKKPHAGFDEAGVRNGLQKHCANPRPCQWGAGGEIPRCTRLVNYDTIRIPPQCYQGVSSSSSTSGHILGTAIHESPSERDLQRHPGSAFPCVIQNTDEKLAETICKLSPGFSQSEVQRSLVISFAINQNETWAEAG